MTTDRLRLHYNENTAGCSPAVIDALRTLTASDVASDPEYDDITATVAAWFGVRSGQVVLTNGLDEGLYAVAQDGVRHWPGAGTFVPVRVGDVVAHTDRLITALEETLASRTN